VSYKREVTQARKVGVEQDVPHPCQKGRKTAVISGHPQTPPIASDVGTSDVLKRSGQRVAAALSLCTRGVSTRCSTRNHACSSPVRMMSETSRSLLPSSPDFAGQDCPARTPFSTFSPRFLVGALPR
jgi:hypothetical protein